VCGGDCGSGIIPRGPEFRKTQRVEIVEEECVCIRERARKESEREDRREKKKTGEEEWGREEEREEEKRREYLCRACKEAIGDSEPCPARAASLRH
jgi:hypothetical protein